MSVWLGVALAAGDPAVPRMAALFEEVCLASFPDGAAVDALMISKGATALTPEQVRVTLRDDAGRGWLVADGEHPIQVTLELPPYHACSVRRMTAAGLSDETPYRAVTARYKAEHPGFRPGATMDRVMGGLRIQAASEQRAIPAGTETLMVFEQRVADPKRIADGETLVSLRFVRQIIADRQTSEQ